MNVIKPRLQKLFPGRPLDTIIYAGNVLSPSDKSDRGTAASVPNLFSNLSKEVTEKPPPSPLTAAGPRAYSCLTLSEGFLEGPSSAQ